MEEFDVGCIGCGAMGGALMRAIAASIGAERVVVTDADSSRAQALAREIGVRAASGNAEIASRSLMLFIAVKPAAVPAVLNEISPILAARSADERAIIVSMAAGVTTETLKSLLPPRTLIVRIMPNTPASVGAGMTAVSPAADTPLSAAEKARALLAAAGRAEILPESLIDAVTAVSGSGPAYGFIFIEALADAAVGLGIPRAQAISYAAQTLKGAAEMVLATARHPAELKDAVCSPAGTTIAAVEALEEKGFRASIIAAVNAAYAAAKK